MWPTALCGRLRCVPGTSDHSSVGDQPKRSRQRDPLSRFGVRVPQRPPRDVGREGQQHEGRPKTGDSGAARGQDQEERRDERPGRRGRAAGPAGGEGSTKPAGRPGGAPPRGERTERTDGGEGASGAGGWRERGWRGQEASWPAGEGATTTSSNSSRGTEWPDQWEGATRSRSPRASLPRSPSEPFRT